ncbi:MAG: glucosamine-6-phosphate deaminase [Verrucomicrobiae bacterium]|nr:glucosamine-6-phosphate deaminase [Verrucomicrobiae bacterium]
MKIVVCKNKEELGQRAAAEGAAAIRRALQRRKHARIIVATGASQFEMLSALVKEELAWHRVTAFHLDEYVGLPITHPASFRLYLWQRFVSRLPVPLAAFHYINGEGDVKAECRRLSRLIREAPIDVAFVGIGENGHLAFNDPPADFKTRQPYIVVTLDEACRRQQVGEGWFPSIQAVPKKAISMSCHQILQAATIICSVPDRRKAEAVRGAVKGPVSPEVPASILQRHRRTFLFLDTESSSLLEG